MMKQIKIGTCISANEALRWLPYMKDMGFETISINCYMEIAGFDFVEFAKRVNDVLSGSETEISCLGYYCNPLQNEEDRKNLEKVIEAAPLFGATVVSTFAGALEGKSVEESIPAFKNVFSELAKRAASQNLKLGIENCPMGGTWNNPTCNIGFNPRAWEMMFEEVPDENLGLQWEPTHQMTQLIDPIPQLRQWVKKIVHMHGKDATVDMDAVRKYGISGAADFALHRTPGFGDVNWRDIISILHMGGYEGDICIEGYHDPIYRDEWELTSQIHALKYLKWCRGGEFIPSPWE